jgi:hypothetical protein
MKMGNPKSILTVNTDITEKKQLESQFLRTQRMESLGTLASGIAHDSQQCTDTDDDGSSTSGMQTPR